MTSDGGAGLEMGAEGLDELVLGADLRVDLGELAEAGEAGLEDLEVGEQQLVLDDRDVAGGVDRALDVDDVAVLEAADDLEDRVRVADVGEELVAEALALARALHQPRDVDELDRRVDDVLRVDHVREDREARVGHRDDGGVGLDGAEGEVLGLRVLGAGEGVEEGGLADVGQADDADVECHGAGSFDGRRGYTAGRRFSSRNRAGARAPPARRRPLRRRKGFC